MPVGDAGTADVISFGEEQFEGDTAVASEPFGVGFYCHAFGDAGGAGGDEFGGAGEFDEAEPAGADVVDALEVAEGGDANAGFEGGVQDGGTFLCGDGFAVNGEGLGRHGAGGFLSGGRSGGSG